MLSRLPGRGNSRRLRRRVALRDELRDAVLDPGYRARQEVARLEDALEATSRGIVEIGPKRRYERHLVVARLLPSPGESTEFPKAKAPQRFRREAQPVG